MPDGPIKRLLGALVANGFVYDTLQRAVGTGALQAHIKATLEPIPAGCVVVDAGGGTGLSRDIWPADCDYVNLDSDPEKLAAFNRKGLRGRAVLGDITALDMEPGSVDYVFIKAVAHHLDDVNLDSFLECSLRVLKPTGRLVFYDPVYLADRFLSRVLWRYDRGSFPRRAGVVLEILNRHFMPTRDEIVRGLFHTYLFYIGVPRAPAA